MTRNKPFLLPTAAAFLVFAQFLAAPARAVVNSTIGMDGSLYPLNSNGYGEVFFPSLGARVQAQAQVPNFRFFADVFGRVYFNRSVPFYLNASEAFVASTSGFAGPVTLTVGRKKVAWSTLDESFRLGIWEPRFRWDPVSPENVGLIGVFAHAQFGPLTLRGFATPIFMPESGVPVNFDNGTIVSPSPFGMVAATQVSVLGTDTPVRYDLQIPAIDRIFVNPGLSLQARLGEAAPPQFSSLAEFDPKPEPLAPEGPWVSSGYSFKPMNQMFMMYKYGLQVETSPYVLLPLQPRIGYHHLVSLEGGFEDRFFSAWVSGLGEVPVLGEDPAGWTTQQAISSLAGSANFEWRFGKAYSDSPRLRVSILRQTGGNAPDGNPPPAGSMSSSGSGSNFEFRYPFQTAVQAQLWTPVPAIAHLFLNSRLLVDVGHDGLIASAALQFLPSRAWAVGLSGDLLVTGITRYTGDKPSDFIGQFHRNSRVQAGFSYAF